MTTGDWSGVVTAACSVIALLGGAVTTVWIAWRRFCTRLDQTDERLDALGRVVRQLARRVGVEIDEEDQKDLK